MAEEKKVATATYVVQRERELLLQGLTDEPRMAWEDIATVTVPAKSKRATVIQTALAQAGITVKPGDEPLRLRALDARSAHVSTVTAEQAAPRVVIA